jgi:hypothetical protein
MMKQALFWGFVALGVFVFLAFVGIFFRLALVIVTLLLLPFLLLFKIIFSKTILALFLVGMVIYFVISRRRKLAPVSGCGDLGLTMAHLEARLDRLNARL